MTSSVETLLLTERMPVRTRVAVLESIVDSGVAVSKVAPSASTSSRGVPIVT